MPTLVARGFARRGFSLLVVGVVAASCTDSAVSNTSQVRADASLSTDDVATTAAAPAVSDGDGDGENPDLRGDKDGKSRDRRNSDGGSGNKPGGGNNRGREERRPEPGPRQAIVDDVCTTLRHESYITARRAVRNGQRRFTDNDGKGYIHTRLHETCPGASDRYQRVDAMASDSERAIETVTTGSGFLDGIGCTQRGMLLQITNRSHRALGVMVIASFGFGEGTRQGSPPLVVWRMDAGESVQAEAPAGRRAAGYTGPCSAVGIPWVAREEPATTAAAPLDDRGRPVRAKDGRRSGLVRSVRSAYHFHSRFRCSAARALLPTFADLRSGSFDRRLSMPRCRQEKRSLFVCPNEIRSRNYAIVEVKLGRALVKIGGRARRVPRELVVGVMRKSPLDHRWRWVVEPQRAGTGPNVRCSVYPAIPVGGA